MKNFLDNRSRYLLTNRFNPRPNQFNDPRILLSSLNRLEEISLVMEETSVFLSNSVDNVTSSIDLALTSLEKRTSSLLSRLSHLNKAKTVLSRAKESSVLLIDLTTGTYNNMIYSANDSGLIIRPVNISVFNSEDI